MHLILNGQSQYWYQNLMKGSKKSRIEFCKYYLYIVDNARYVYTDESHFYTKKPYSER